MKGSINPQNISESSLNLPSIDINTNFQFYEQQKKARKQTENQRKNLELAVAALRRQAFQASKRLNQNQDELMFTYNKKLITLDENNKKEQFKRQEREQLQKRKNFSNLTRYLHRVKKEEAVKNMSERRKNTISQMKSYLEQANARKNKEKKQQLRQLSQRRRRMSQTNRSNVRWARSKSLRQKAKLSEFVRNQLIGIEESRINKQQQTIQKLQDEKNKILQMLQKNRLKNMELDSMKEELSGMDMYDFESRVIKNNQESRITVATRKIEKSKRKREEQRNRDNFYY